MLDNVKKSRYNANMKCGETSQKEMERGGERGDGFMDSVQCKHTNNFWSYLHCCSSNDDRFDMALKL